MNDLKQVKENISVLAPEFPDMDVAQCVTYTVTLDKDQVPSLSNSNSSTYPPYATHLPPVNCILQTEGFG
jgi:hypothetical protein